MSKTATYAGVHNEVLGGMTTIGKVVRDAWVFGLIPESETCQGWNLAGIDGLLQRVNAEWDKYGCLVSQLPDELFKRHGRIHGAAISRARAAGWSGELETDDDA